MKVHTIILTHNNDALGRGIDPSMINPGITNGSLDIEEPVQIATFSRESEKEKGDLHAASTCEDDRYLSDPAYQILSGRERLKPPDFPKKAKVHNLDADEPDQSSDEEPYVVPDEKRREEIMKSVYNFDREP